MGGLVRGRGDIEAVYRSWFTSFPDLRFIPEDLIVDRDRAVQIWRVTGTHSGAFAGLAATGKRFEVTGAFVYRFKDGLIAHERRIYDFTGLLLQLGVLKAKPH